MAPSGIITLDCGQLRIELQRVRDRWEHAIGIIADKMFQQIARSVEGQPDELWPSSPTLQELHVEARSSGQVALMTGMAGTSHWSASIVCEPALHQATFDVACRCKASPAWLGSLYQIPEWVHVQHADRIAELQLPHSASRLIASSDGLLGSIPQFVEPQTDGWTGAFIEYVKGLRRTLFVAPNAQESRTIRWAYTFRLANP